MKERVANFMLRAGVAFAFLYPPVNALFDPYSWLGYLPHFARAIAHTGGVPDVILLHSFGALEVIIALWILSNKKIFLPSLAATGILLAIVALNLQDFQVVFRDLSIAAASLSLAVMSYRSTPSGNIPGQR
jgi:hypothetical protein